MPKELQRSLLEYKIIFKSRLGRGVESEMIKFQVCMYIEYSMQCMQCLAGHYTAHCIVEDAYKW